jgi:micrococcal nuclease
MYTYRATVRRVVDGDTVDLDIDLRFSVILRNQRIRLHRVDTPEKRTRDLREKAAGRLASQIVEELLPLGSECTIETYLDSRGKFGRLLGEIVTDEGICVNDYLINHRYAIEYMGQSKDEVRALHEANWHWLEQHGLL